MVQRGLDWIDCLCTRPLIQRNVLFSFYLQLYPAISWGLVTTVLPPATIEKKVQALYFKSLPLMGINGNIKKEWQSLPTMYQGLGLPCFPLVALAKKISFLQENWGNTGVAQSDALSLAYDDFIMEVGLYGNPLSWEYINYGQLATQATWFSNLWQLCHTYQATVSINKSGRQITPICKNNRSIMSEFYCIGFCGNQLVGLNTVQKYKHFIHVSDMILCDGRTIDPFSLSDEQILSVQHVFSREEPTHANFSLRRSAISSLCEGTTRLPYALGPFVLPPHLEVYWYTNLDSSIL